MRKIILAIIISCAYFFSTATFAVKVTRLYQAELPVAVQSDELRDNAVKQGMQDVLMKLTGDSSILTKPIIKSSLNKAAYFVQEYSYSSSPAASEYIITIHYDPDAITRLLKKAGVNYWNQTRPLILTWLVVTDKKHETELIGNETPLELLSDLKQQSEKYGLPLIFPMMDMTDLNQVTVNDVLEFAIPSLRAAAKRYAPDALLIGKLDETDEGLQSQWQFVLNTGNQWDFTLESKTPAELSANVIDQVSRVLAKQYVSADPVSSETWLQLEVKNITQNGDLVQLMDYLKHLTPVEKVELGKVSGNAVQVAVLVKGTAAAFEQNAMIGQHLQKTEENMVYEWVH